MQKILFVDRDGTLIEEPPDHQVDALEKVRLAAGVVPALIRLKNKGFRFVMVTNQDGLGTASFPTEHFERCQNYVVELFRSQGIEFDRVFVCPHLAADGCDCRKPRTGLVTRFLAETVLDTSACAVVGDRDTDLEFAERIGIRGMLLRSSDGYEHRWDGIADALCATERQGVVERTTAETRVRAAVNLDTDAPVEVATGIGFFDHMLQQIAKHGGFSLRLECSGDLDVDEHHTVEDTAICLGAALRQALGDKRGIGRYGFLLPMDESVARIALDLSGRAFFDFKGKIPRQQVGGLPTELVPHFFRSFADALGAALHVEIHGDNAHHMVEACFKGVGRSLRRAIRRDGDAMPSTKELLA
ncbi:MAG: bifunctional histidinol-phosphatase/imidazoleglycerol-phosphate dehydratase HisB [Woeseiaceae bacterium]